MSKIELWPHQTAAIAATESAMHAGVGCGLWSMPTGSGKTVTFTTFARRLGLPTLVMVHRDELIRQTVATLADVWPAAHVGVVQGDRNEWGYGPDVAIGYDVVVASVQSMHERRLAQIPSDLFGLIVVDEAHHAVAETWQAIIHHFSQHRFVLGVTATPDRADGKGLAELFGPRPLYSYPLRSCIDDGHLARITQYQIETTTDLSSVTKRHGDFATGELTEAVNTPERNRVIVDAYQSHASDRRAIAFCVGVQHAESLAETFFLAGVPAAHVSGDMPVQGRRDILRGFAAGDIRVLANCAVLTEGFDDRGIEAVLMARPTMSRSLYTQCIGRGLRKAPGKTDCLILDYTDNSQRHKLITVLDLFGAPHATDAAGADAIEVADYDRDEAERLCEIVSQRPLKWRLASVCPWPELPNLSGYVKASGWHGADASSKQLAYLNRQGLDVSRGITKGEASYLIDRCMDFEAQFPSPATSKQRYCLRRAGLWRDGLSKKEASRLIGQFKAQAYA
jgi:superfamily II DNA or RNA helicase